MWAVNPSDARLQPGCIVSTTAGGVRMAEVMKVAPGRVTLLDCKTDALFDEIPWNVIHKWQLVRHAPSAPEWAPNPDHVC